MTIAYGDMQRETTNALIHVLDLGKGEGLLSVKMGELLAKLRECRDLTGIESVCRDVVEIEESVCVHRLALGLVNECGKYVAKKQLCQSIFNLLRACFCRCENLCSDHTHEGLSKICDQLLVPMFQGEDCSPEQALGWASFVTGGVGFNCKSLKHLIAIPWWEKSLRCALACKDAVLKFEASLSLGLVAQEAESQTSHFATMVEAASELGKNDYLAYGLFKLAMSYMYSGNFGAATDISKQLTTLSSNIEQEDTFVKGMAAKLDGTISQIVGQHEECIRKNLEAVKYLKDVPSCYKSCYESYFEGSATCGNPTKAEWTAECLAESWNQIALCHCTLEHPKEAFQALKQREGLLDRIYNIWDSRFISLEHFNLVAAVHLCGGRSSRQEQSSRLESLRQAEEYAEKSRNLANEMGSCARHLAAIALKCLAEVKWEEQKYRPLHSYEIIDGLLAEAERLATGPSNLIIQMLIIQERGLLSFRMKRLEEAHTHLIRCVQPFLKLDYGFGGFGAGRVSYYDQLKHIFRMLQASSLSSPPTSLVWGERERARDLHRTFKSKKASISAQELLFDADDEKAFREILEICTGETDTAFLVFATINMNVGMCQYYLHSDVVRGHYFEFNQPSAVSERVRRTAKSIKPDGEVSREDESCDELLMEWYKDLIQPFEQVLEETNPKKLVIIPGEELSMLPFAALFKERGQPFLIQRFAISCIPSIRMFKQCRQSIKLAEEMRMTGSGKYALVIRNPGGDLPGAAMEAEFVTKLLQETGYTTKSLKNATREMVLEELQSSSWVHVASHAVVCQEFPNGALVLATGSVSGLSSSSDSSNQRFLSYVQGMPTDGSLTADEIEKLELLRAQAMVLSACSTGLGQMCSEGVLGLYRSLHRVGVPAVMVSLWDIEDMIGDKDDETTMSLLYRNLKQGMELGLALQKAMVDMIEKEDELGCPAYKIHQWAPFMISGYPDVKLACEIQV